jgi:O-antigen/teichoic acid export membrane protein
MRFADLLVGNVVFRSLNIVMNILITVLLTRLMSVEGYGIFSLLVANASIFNLVTCLGVESGITYHYASKDISKEKIFSIIYSVSLFQVVLLVIAEIVHHTFTGTYWLFDQGNHFPLLWAAIYIAALGLIDKYSALLNGAHLYTLCNKIIFFSNLATVLLFAFFYFFRKPVFTFFYLELVIAAAAFQAMLLIVVFHSSSRYLLSLTLPERDDWRRFFSYSFIVFITNVIQFFAYRVDYWILNFYHGREQVGLYSLAVRFAQLLWVLPILFASIIFPQVADMSKVQDTRKLLSLVRIANTIVLIGGVIAYAVAGVVIPLVAGEAFRPSIVPFHFLLPGILLFSLNIMLAAFFAGKGRLKVNLTASSICFASIVALDLLLIPRYGNRGAAIATSISYSLSTFYLIWKFRELGAGQSMNIFLARKEDWKTIRNYLKATTA